MDAKIIELLLDLARSHEGLLPDRCPLVEISDLGDEAVSGLIHALGHYDPLVRRMAAYALAPHSLEHGHRSGTEQAIPHLERMIEGDPAPLTRIYAAEALWHLTESEKAITAFVDGLKNPDVETRRYAVMILGLLALEGQNTIPPLTAALDDPDLEVRTTAASGLAEFGSAAREALPGIERLLDEGDFARVTAIHAILNIDPSRAEELTPMLVAEVKSGTGHVRQRTVQVLGEIPATGALAVETLIALLDDADRIIREEAINSLRSLGPVAAPAVPKMAEILRGQGKDGGEILVRDSAATALREIGPAAQEAVPSLVNCLVEPAAGSFGVYFRLHVAHALWAISMEPGYLLAVGPEALHAEASWLRHAAAALLGDLGTRGEIAIPQLRWTLHDGDHRVRDAAQKALEKITATA